jgi:FAD synthase
LRDEQKFAGIDALVAQMNRDAEQARQFFARRSAQA